MKKVSKVLVVLLIAIFSTFVLASCNDKESVESVSPTGSVESVSPTGAVESNRLIIVDKAGNTLYDQKFDTDKTTLKAVLDEKEIPYTMDGTMVSSVYGRSNPIGWSYCWMFYTDADGMTDGTDPYTYDGVQYGRASYGITELQIKQGATYVIVFVKF